MLFISIFDFNIQLIYTIFYRGDILKLNNYNNLNSNERYKLKKKGKVGAIIVTTLGLAVGFSLGNAIKDSNKQREINTMIESEKNFEEKNIDKNQVNDLNIIINDCDCSDTLFESVCNYLRDDGIVFQQSMNNANINNDDCVIITLDQQYTSGTNTYIFAPFNNTRIGNSDSLALSMQAAFSQNGFLSDEILCGIIGYRENPDGSISSILPTKTEEAIDSSKDASFITVSFGTENVNAEWVAKSIENGLCRYCDYLNNYDSQSDLIYRSSPGEDTETVANYFGVNNTELCKFNKLDSNNLHTQTIINPVIQNIAPFNKVTIYNIDNVKTKAY
jgi:hypothetical protein